MTFTTVPEALRAAGRAGHDALGELRGADCGAPVEGVSGALPGAKAAGASGSFANSWTSTFTTWCNDAEQHSTALDKAADAYITGDDCARSSLPDGGKLTGPR
jgi:hypothetical protein